MNNTTTMTKEKQSFFKFWLSELKPKGKIITPFNIISAVVIITAIILLIDRFINGLGAVSNLTQETPWGLWKGFNVVTGVAFAGGAYVTTFIVYILNVKRFKPLVRITVLNGFLAYTFYAIALILDLGKPWNIINPIIGNDFGASSVLFLVAWHFLLYVVAQLIEFSPAVAEWVGAKRAHKILTGMTIGAVIFGITLSILHQSGLGALFLMASEKIHPLWYNEFIPILFLVSSIFAGMAMIIFEGMISEKVFRGKQTEEHFRKRNRIIFSLAKICTGAMFAYFFLQAIVFIHGQHWGLLGTGYGLWYLLELIGFVLIPMFLFIYSYKKESVKMVKTAAILTIIGIILNRMNVSVITYDWQAAVPYIPSWKEVVVTFAVIFGQILIFRWIIRRMPVISDSPLWAKFSNH
jgi:Ni/Fe-hydrogenase subunit HybB-like protein